MLPTFASYVYWHKRGSKTVIVIKCNTYYFSWKIYKRATLTTLQQKKLFIK